MNGPGEMPAGEVVRIVDWLESAGVIYQVNGGWGVDALVGRQTRPHRDLDIFLDAAREDDFLAWLFSRGCRMVEDWRPVRSEVVCHRGRVDVHPMMIDEAGDGFQKGLSGETYVHAARDRVCGWIGGRPVIVASAARSRELRMGYPARDVDRHDLDQLDNM